MRLSFHPPSPLRNPRVRARPQAQALYVRSNKRGWTAERRTMMMMIKMFPTRRHPADTFPNKGRMSSQTRQRLRTQKAREIFDLRAALFAASAARAPSSPAVALGVRFSSAPALGGISGSPRTGGAERPQFSCIGRCGRVISPQSRPLKKTGNDETLHFHLCPSPSSARSTTAAQSVECFEHECHGRNLFTLKVRKSNPQTVVTVEEINPCPKQGRYFTSFCSFFPSAPFLQLF